jgi:hypothetical protein
VRAVLAAAVAGAAGCRGGGDFANENDALREKVLDLERDLARSRRRITELEAELATIAAVEAGDEVIHANTPHVATLDIGRLSHVRDLDEDGTVDTLVLYVTPADGLGRFVQLVGELTAHAAVLPGGGEAVTIGRVVLPPGELRASYRSGVTGTHYTVHVPIAIPPDAGVAEGDVSVVYTDGRTGRRHEAHRAVALR